MLGCYRRRSADMRRFPSLLAVALFLTGTPAEAASAPVTLLVNPLIGTSTTRDEDGQTDVIDDFPGADVPFGMVQWSPDTPSQNAGGGYEFGDREITGFSLTHLSGPGCSVFGDFGILPTVGAVDKPWAAKQPFLHSPELASPGSYAVTLGEPGIRSELTVTRRTGIGQFTYPASAGGNLLFNVSSDQAGVRDAGFHIVGPDEVSGYADTGGFCGMPDRYSAYFVAKFDRPFASFGTWKSNASSPGSRSVEGAGSGGWVSFDPSGSAAVKMKVGLSFVDEAGARANLHAENKGWDLLAVRNAAASQWQRMLSRVAIEGGTAHEKRIFYTALYHALLHPNLYNDVTGSYRGFDGAIHRVRAGHSEYANFSDWDIYRTLVPLLALIAPDETSDMLQSLVDAAKQDVFLPRWALLNGATSVMGGDSPDVVIAGGYAFGARDFDLRDALAAMVKGASDTTVAPADGWYVERPELAEYLQRGYIVNNHTTSVSPVPNGASETLEYALDDFSIARFARSVGATATYREYLKRSANWATLFDTTTGLVAPRDSAGAFMHTPITSNGQSGFQEGNAAQYTWMVPQDLHGLITGMGGNAAAIAKLDTFFTKLNAGGDEPYAWLGNEPTIGSPWVYLSAGAPWRAQQIVRRALTTMYDDSPSGLPGNDDLGTMSAWYVWSAIGLYPQNPAVRRLVIGSPLFRRVVIRAPHGPTLDIRAPQASDATPFVRHLRMNGSATQRTWLDLPMHGAVRLDFDLGATPDKQWGSGLDDAPPSYEDGPVAFEPATSAKLTALGTSRLVLPPAAAGALQFGISNPKDGRPAKVTWRAELPPPLAAQPSSGTLDVGAGTSYPVSMALAASADAKAGLYDVRITARAGNGALLEALTATVRVARPGELVPLGYIENRFDNTVTPFDPTTNAVGPAIPVGTEPRDAVLSPDGKRLYVADRGAQSISAIDTAGQSVSATIKVGNSPNGVAITPDGKQLWIANYDDGTIQSIDTATLRVGEPVAVGTNPRSIAIAPDGATLYVTNNGSNTVTPVDVRSGVPKMSIAVGAKPSGIAITPDGKTAFVVNSGSNDVTPLDLTESRALPAIHAGVFPILIAISPDGSLAYVTNYASITITPIDVRTRTARPAITVGGAPYGVAFSRDSKTAYVVLRRDNAFVPVDVSAGRAGTPIILGTSPYTISLP
jgi:predicted alpha-1,2-mannosidase